ncbi:MAG TPA: hypothetical protein PLP59_06980 [Thermotogota bacterium]|nr:hypothetical protein [Thermotogota bacterium]MDD8052778.1 hypothetical protein [Thermotogota bacterium]HOZ12199.1 hypothetical protein [Thermotogota bacterium]HPB87249.1 hypothetical protein [Thermotogota bacterium]HPH09988.1 hypothetical protein [Thermotogota bacterium]
MEIFTMKRIRRLFREDGRSLIVAMDHGSAMNVFPDLSDTPSVLRAIVQNGADTVLTSFGILKNYWRILEDTGVILRLDGGITSFKEGGKRYSQLFTVEDALRLGADAVGCMGLPGCDFENDTLSYLSGICSEAHQWNVPVLAEMLPGGFNQSAHTPTNLAVAARIGVELGADIIKTDYPENPDAFKEMVAGIDKPIVVLGGVKSDHTEEFFETIRSALDAGASGIAVGRNIWGYREPGKMTAALCAIIHDEAPVEKALRILK